MLSIDLSYNCVYFVIFKQLKITFKYFYLFSYPLVFRKWDA